MIDARTPSVQYSNNIDMKRQHQRFRPCLVVHPYDKSHVPPIQLVFRLVADLLNRLANAVLVLHHAFLAFAFLR